MKDTAHHPELFLETPLGCIWHGDSLAVMRGMGAGSVDLVMTSPPFALTRKKEYGNEQEGAYLDWFRAFAAEFRRILRDSGSLVIDLGGAWKPGVPVRSLYHFKLLIMLCEDFGFHLAQEFYWWNPSKLPSPAEWVNVRRIRVKDAVNTVWWLSKTEWPKAANRRVLQPYSPSMEQLLAKGYRAKLRPSGHDISENFGRDNGAAIPPNLLAIPNTESNSAYMRYCQERGIKPHPARFPADLPEYFIRMLTDPGDLVFDPFAGSCITGEVAERLARRWACAELSGDYLEGARGRFPEGGGVQPRPQPKDDGYYRLPRPSLLWNGPDPERLDPDGGASALQACEQRGGRRQAWPSLPDRPGMAVQSTGRRPCPSRRAVPKGAPGQSDAAPGLSLCVPSRMITFPLGDLPSSWQDRCRGTSGTGHGRADPSSQPGDDSEPLLRHRFERNSEPGCGRRSRRAMRRGRCWPNASGMKRIGKQSGREQKRLIRGIN
jgi:site-specific DNA-methyltransferase (cytosine-N4-specific)